MTKESQTTKPTTPYHRLVRAIAECIPMQYWKCLPEPFATSVNGAFMEIQNEERN